jgi:hypothetical protein
MRGLRGSDPAAVIFDMITKRRVCQRRRGCDHDETPITPDGTIVKTQTYAQAFSCNRAAPTVISFQGEPAILSAAGLEEPGYAEFES